ncbi:MAG: hypothetical protein ACREFE_04465 [Limisphaerales bacterium]
MNKPTKSKQDSLKSEQTQRTQQDDLPSPQARTKQRLKIILANLDKADAEIGRMIGVTRAAIFDLRVRYKIEKVRSNTQKKERMIKLASKLPSGLSVPEAAEKLGLPERHAYYYAKSAGYQFERRNKKDDDWKKRFRALPAGLTLMEVAQQFGVSYVYTVRLCQKYGYKVRRAGSSKAPRLPIRR